MKRSISQLKDWFRRGKYPTEAQFADWLDSYFHKDETVPVSRVENLAWLLNGKFSTSRGEAVETLAQTLRREFDRHKEDSDDEFEKIENNRQAFAAEDERQQKEIDAQQIRINAAAGQLETVRKLLGGASWATVKGAFDGLGGNYSNLWALANTVKTFLEASDTSDATINRWQELEAFLEGVTDDESLAGMLEKMKHDIGEAHVHDLSVLAKQLSCEEMTYSELAELRDSGKLMPGTLYRITDYETMVSNDPEARSAGHPFDVVVMALDSRTLSERAWAMHSIRDTAGYFAGAKLEAWQVWYCPDNDTRRFQWADAANGKGVIYRLVDEWGNDCPYDFKNVQFKRYRIIDQESPLNGKYYGFQGGNDYIWAYTFSMAHIELKTTLSEWVEGYTYGAIANDGEWDSVDNEDIKKDYSQQEDASLNQYKGGKTFNGFNGCRHNVIREFYTAVLVDETTVMVPALNNIVLYSSAEVCASDYGAPFLSQTNNSNNTFELHCCNFTFGVGCEFNNIGGNSKGNISGDWCANNTFGKSCSYNTLGKECIENRFGNGCEGNMFGQYCSNNTLGNGNIKTRCGNHFRHNSLGDSCNGNSFGDDCENNTFGNSCSDNTFGNSCSDNRFGNDFRSNRFGNYLQYITAGEGVMYLNVTGGSDSYHCVQNAIIVNGTRGTGSSHLTVALPEQSDVCRYVGKNTAGTLKIWVPADLV